jgi:transposase
MIEAGHGTTDVARRLKVDPRSVRRWKADYRRRGTSGLDARPASGRPPKLSEKDRRTLRKLLLKGAKANGWPTELWTCPRLVQLIERRFGVRYHVDHLPRLLRGLGFSCQKPARRAKERDEEAIKRWVAVDWPRIKKRRRVSGPTSSSSTKRG